MDRIKEYISVRSVLAAASALLFGIGMLVGVGVGNGLGSFFNSLINIAAALLLLVNFTFMRDKRIFATSVSIAAFTKIIGIFSVFVNYAYRFAYLRAGISSIISITASVICLAALAFIAAEAWMGKKIIDAPLDKVASAVLLAFAFISFVSTLSQVGGYGRLIAYWFLMFFEVAAWLCYTAALFLEVFEKELKGLFSHVNVQTGTQQAPNACYADEAERLRELKRALDSGILTNEEYQAKREEIIQNM